jgi:hypothetical protein
MQKVTTKAMAKVAAVATGLAMATSMLSLAPMAHAASLTSSQVQSILSLLSSFGADSSTIANVQSSLTGGTPSSTTSGSTTTSSSSYTFTRDLTVGSTGADVMALQNALITKGYLTTAKATNYFGALTKAAVIKWQKAAGVTPAAGYFGAKSRAAFGGTSSSSTTTTTTTTTGTTTTGAGTGTGLKVSLSPTTPNNTVLVQGQGIGDLADFVFSNPTAAPINVTALSFKRIGVSNDATLANVYLYNAGTRLTDSAGVSASAFTFSDPVALFMVPANSTYTVSVRSDIAAGSSGQQLGVQLVNVTPATGSALDSSVSYPINSDYQTISNAQLATVSYQLPTSQPGSTISAQNDYPVWQDTVSVSQNPVQLSSMAFTNLGSIDTQYLVNLRLYVDGVQVGSAIPSMSSARTVTFDLSAAPVSLSTQSHVIKVLANITGGAGRTIVFSVQRSSDAMFVDSQLGQPVTPVVSTGNFTAVSSGTITLSSVLAGSGVSVTRDPASPNQQVSVGASNVLWGSFDMLASGENVKVSDLYVYATDLSSTSVALTTGGLKNGKILVNGVQVGSTKDIGNSSANHTDFSLGSSLILPAGQTTVVGIYADANDTSNTNLPNGALVTVYLDGSSTYNNAQGQSSLNSTSVPATPTYGNQITVSNSALTASEYTGYGNQTIVAGANSAKLGSFTLSTGSTGGVTVNTIALDLVGNTAITNLTLKDDATGTILGQVQTTPAATGNSFAVSNMDIPASSSKVIDVYGNVLTGTGVTAIRATVTVNTQGTGDTTGISTVVAAPIQLQAITIGLGTLTVTRGAGDPVSNNVLAGASSVQVGEFNFAAQNTQYTVQNLEIAVNNSSDVTGVTLSYKDVNGATQTVTQPVIAGIATYTGLTMFVPTNDSANLDVYVGTPTIASGATSGAGINVTLKYNANFRAVDSAGNSIALVGSADVPSNGTFYVRKSIPTFAMISTGNAVPSTGTPLYKFSISADPAGAIEWTHLVFNIATSSGVSVSNVYLTDDSSGTNLIDAYATTTATTATVDLGGNTTQAKYAQVAAGTTKTYDLYGIVAGYTTGSTLTISLAADGSYIANEVAAPYVAGNIVWSDRSMPGHTTGTADWTNGYLIKNFTSNAVSYSK